MTILEKLREECRDAMHEAGAQDGPTAETVANLAATLMNVVDCLRPIERVLIAQLTERRDRLAGELTYAQGRSRPNEQHIRIIGERLAAVKQQLEELEQ